MAKLNLLNKFFNAGPLLLLYFLAISEVDTNLEKLFEIFTFNLPIIIIFFWILKRPLVMGTGHIFVTGLINDVVMGFPLGISSLTYLIVSLVATYIKNMTVHTTIASDWFTFLIAILFSNTVFYILASNFSEIVINITEISYNTFFTLLFFPFFWIFFNYYNSFIRVGKNA